MASSSPPPSAAVSQWATIGAAVSPENSWEVKQQKREAAIAAIKRSTEYQLWTLCQLRDIEDLPIVAPDPTNQSISNRAWEKSVREWRNHLKQAVGMLLAKGPKKSKKKRAPPGLLEMAMQRRPQRQPGIPSPSPRSLRLGCR